MMGKVIMSGIVPKLTVPVEPVKGTPVGDLAVGSSVYLNEGGTLAEYIIVNQGIPSNSSLYDSSCDGTWVLRKDIIKTSVWNNSSVNDYTQSIVYYYFRDTFMNLFDTTTKNQIKTVKIPCAKNGYIQTGSNGASVQAFVLSASELGYDTDSRGDTTGAKLSYFETGTETTSANNKRIAYYNGTAKTWWTRTIRYTGTTTDRESEYVVYGSEWSYYTPGTFASPVVSGEYGVRPALVLHSDILVTETGDGTFTIVA